MGAAYEYEAYTTGNQPARFGLSLCKAGICLPAGAQGADCSKPLLRPCTNRFRDRGTEPLGWIDAAGRDLDLRAQGYTESRCGGEALFVYGYLWICGCL